MLFCKYKPNELIHSWTLLNFIRVRHVDPGVSTMDWPGYSHPLTGALCTLR